MRSELLVPARPDERMVDDAVDGVRDAYVELAAALPGPTALEWVVRDHGTPGQVGRVVTEDAWREALAGRQDETRVEVTADAEEGIVSAWLI